MVDWVTFIICDPITALAIAMIVVKSMATLAIGVIEWLTNLAMIVIGSLTTI